MAVLQTPLPIAFRINGSGPFAAGLRRRFESDFFSKITDDTLKQEGALLAMTCQCRHRPRARRTIAPWPIPLRWTSLKRGGLVDVE